MAHVSAPKHCEVNNGHGRRHCCFILCHFAKLTNAAIEQRLGANAAKRVEFVANVERGQRSYWRRRRALIASMVGDAAIPVVSCARL